MRKQLYLSIIERLKEIKNMKGESLIRRFDLWNEQVIFLEQEEAFELPAAFIEFLPVRWRQLNDGTQEAAMQFRIHIVTEFKGSSADGSVYQKDALEVFDLLDQVNANLSGMKGENFRGMFRIESSTNHNHEEVIESLETFQVNVTDITGKRDIPLPSWAKS